MWTYIHFSTHSLYTVNPNAFSCNCVMKLVFPWHGYPSIHVIWCYVSLSQLRNGVSYSGNSTVFVARVYNSVLLLTDWKVVTYWEFVIKHQVLCEWRGYETRTRYTTGSATSGTTALVHVYITLFNSSTSHHQWQNMTIFIFSLFPCDGRVCYKIGNYVLCTQHHLFHRLEASVSHFNLWQWHLHRISCVFLRLQGL